MELTLDTPICVIEFLAKYLGVMLEDKNSISSLYKTTTLIQKYYKDPDSDSNIARFVNIDQYICWDYKTLHKAYSILDEMEISDIEHYNVGYQTPDNINRLNEYYLYKLCVKHHIECNLYTTSNDMYCLLYYKAHYNEAITISDYMNYEFVKNILDKKECELYSVKHLKYNISHSSNPSMELIYKLSGRIYDEKMKFVTNINPKAYDLRKGYDHIIPSNKYNPERFLIYGIVGSYNHYCVNKVSPIYMDELDQHSNIICIGSQLTGYKAYLMDEIMEGFRCYSYFYNPDTNSEFNDQHIKQLIRICKVRRCVEMLNVISEVKKPRVYTDIYSLDLNSTIRYLTKLFELAMCLRGWDGVGDYPLTIAIVPDNVPIYLKTSPMILDILSDKYMEYNNLPLLRKGGIRTIDSRNGFTIGDRLIIMKEGKNGNISCIRITSNFLCYSSYYHYKYITGHKLFDMSIFRELQ